LSETVLKSTVKNYHGDFNLPDCDWDFYHAPDNVVYNGFLKFINSYGFSHC